MNINELYKTYYSLESYINELESQLIIDLALEGYSYEDIATESIGSKIKSAFSKIRKGNKSEGERELKEVTDELKEEENNAETEEEKKKLSTKKKIAIAAAIAAMTATAIALAKSKNKKDRQKAEIIQKQVKAVSKTVSNKAPHVKAVSKVSKTVSNKAPEEIKTNDVPKTMSIAEEIKTNDVSKTISMAKNTVLLLEKPKEQTDSQNNGISADERSNRERDIKNKKEDLKGNSKYILRAGSLRIDSPTRGAALKKLDKLMKERKYWANKAKNEKDPEKRKEYIKRRNDIFEKIVRLNDTNLAARVSGYKQTNDPKRIQELQEKSKMIIRKRDHLDDMYRNGKISKEKYIKAIKTIDDGLIRITAMVRKE